MNITSNLTKISSEQDKIKNRYSKLFEAIKKQDSFFNYGFTTNVIKVNSDYIVHNEMMLIRVSKKGKIIWESPCHGDVLTEIEILKNKIKVTEFNGKSYYLDKESGKEVS